MDFLKAFRYSNKPDGNFNGPAGIINRISLLGHKIVDMIMNRHETHYETVNVMGITLFAMTLFSIIISLIIKSQMYLTVIRNLPKFNSIGTSSELDSDVHENVKNGKDSSGKYNQLNTEKDGTGTKNGADTNISTDTSPETGFGKIVAYRGRHELHSLKNDDDYLDISYDIKAGGDSLMKYSGISKIVTIYTREESYKFLSQPIDDSS
ncbi:uncharacterized protein LOC108104979 [Drosophila eugracilis]|uniref:uncharacterized protein LOC108104979 n=1 Tax=Drosophila eugracilis TaxID=29029 RepID=UPI0007E86A4E|nr:uncharacterized protein LOC108104979 [Drosophila eugracilis]